MVFKRLHGKLVGLQVLSVTVALIVFFAVVEARTYGNLETELTTRYQGLADSLMGPIASSVWSLDLDVTTIALDTLKREGAFYAAHVVDSDGITMVIDGPRDGDTAPNVAKVSRRLTLQKFGDPVEVGTLDIFYRTDVLGEWMAERLLIDGLLLALIALVLLLVTNLTLSRLVGNPLKKLMTSINETIATRERHLVSWASHDELGVAIQAYNEMQSRQEENERGLRESRESLRTTLHSIGDAVIATDTSANVTRMNPVAEKLTGWDLGEAVGRPLSEVFHVVNAKTKEPAFDPVQTVLESDKIVGLDNHIMLIARNGTGRQIADSAAPIRDNAGTITGVVLVFRDVTEEYAVREALKESEARFKRLFESAAISIWNEDFSEIYQELERLRRDGVSDLRQYLRENTQAAWDLAAIINIIDVNTAALTLFGAETKESLIDSLHKTFKTDSIDVFIDELCAIWEKKKSFRSEVTQKTMNGDELTVIISMQIPVTEEGFNNVPVSIQDITERKLIEDALVESEQRFRAAFENVAVGNIVIDDTGIVESFNEAAQSIFGYAAEEVTGKNVKTLMPEPYRSNHDQYIDRYLETGEPRIICIGREVAGLRKSGEEFPMHLAVGEILVGGKRSFIGSITDLTEVKTLEKQLKTTLNNVVEGVVTIDETGIIRSFNPAAERMFGFTAAEAIGRNIKMLMPEPDRGKHDEYIGRFLETGEARIIGEPREVTGQRKDGTAFQLDLGIAEMRLGDQRSFVGTLRDITERKAAEEQLRMSEDRLRRSVLEAPIPIMIHADDGEVLMISKRWTALSGYSHADIPTILDWTEKAYGANREHRHDFIRGLYEIEEPIENETYVTTAQGEQRTWEFRTAPLGRLPDGRRFIISMAVDITARKAAEMERERLEEQLRQAQKMEAVGTLAGGIAHDFNNILAGMVGYAHLAMDAVPAKDQVHGDLEQLLKGIDRATSLVQQILAFSRLSGGERHPVDVSRVVDEALKLTRATFSSTIEIERQIDRKAGTVMADATQLQQVVMNLCNNAADAIGQVPGTIEVGLARVEIGDADAAMRPDLVPGSYVKLSVSDSGAGMDAATQLRVFEPFFTTKEPGKGTGLGLSVVHGIVRGHGGTIEVDSAPGRGATFTLLLPRVEAAERGAAPADRNVPRGRERILLVDDEAAIVRSEQRLLERLGYKVEVATSSVGALERFRATPEAFDLVITDRTMPDLTGMALAREILKVRGDVPIVLCSGFSETVSAEDVAATIIREFITKPIHPDDLARAVRRALDRDV